MFEAINFVKITKESLYKTHSLACFLARRDTPVAATLQRKSFGGIIFVIITKKITKIIVPGNYFVIMSARMVRPKSFLAPPFCWTKFPKKVANLKRSFRNLIEICPEIRPEIFRAFLAGRKVLPKHFTRFFPSEMSNFKSKSKSNFTNNFTNILLQAWQP